MTAAMQNLRKIVDKFWRDVVLVASCLAILGQKRQMFQILWNA